MQVSGIEEVVTLIISFSWHLLRKYILGEQLKLYIFFFIIIYIFQIINL